MINLALTPSKEDIGKDWAYFKFSPAKDIRIIERGDNEYMAAVMVSTGNKSEVTSIKLRPQASGDFVPNVINTTIDGVDGFLINDLLSTHPTRKGFWKIVGRADDQIMHSTGEKTNPGPLGEHEDIQDKYLFSEASLERMLMNDPHVSGAVMFGHSRFNCGVLVNPTKEHVFDRADAVRLAEFRNLIWSVSVGSAL